ncbi:MAG TPA: hypothetical protein VF752_16260 [Thermoleophilaceae bacterium]
MRGSGLKIVLSAGLVTVALVCAVQPAGAAVRSKTFRDDASGLRGTYKVTVTRVSAVALRVRTDASFRASRSGHLTLFSGCQEIYCTIESWPFDYKKGSNRLVFENVASGFGDQFDNSGGGGGTSGGGQSLIDQLLSGLPVLGPIVDPVLGPILDPLPAVGASRSTLTRHQRRVLAARKRMARRRARAHLTQIREAAARLLPVRCGQSSLYVPGAGQVADSTGICVP